jgi:transcriptional regulator with XRE-family HTH domain
MDDYSLAERLRVARAHKGWSQIELARRAKLHSVQISKLERGVTREITGSTLRALCQALGVSPAYILGMTDDMGIDKKSTSEPTGLAVVSA